MLQHPGVPHPRDRQATDTLSDRVTDGVAGWFGTLFCFWVLVVWMLAWMILAGFGVWYFKDDKQLALLLFLSNLVQLWALPILGAATNRADMRRAAKADADHEALTSIHRTVDAILDELGGRHARPVNPVPPIVP